MSKITKEKEQRLNSETDRLVGDLILIGLSLMSGVLLYIVMH